MADAQQTGEYGSSSDHVVGCLSSPCLELKAWKISGELLVFSLQGNLKRNAAVLATGWVNLPVGVKAGRQTTQFLFHLPLSGLEGRYHLHQGGSFLFELVLPRKSLTGVLQCCLFSWFLIQRANIKHHSYVPLQPSLINIVMPFLKNTYSVCVWADMPWCMCGGQKAACGNQLSPSTMRVPWIESVGSLAANVLTLRRLLACPIVPYHPNSIDA